MTFEEAIRKAIQAYFDPDEDTTLSPEVGNTKFTPEYFDALEEEFVPKKDQKAEKGKK